MRTSAFVGKNIIQLNSVDQTLFKTAEVLLTAHKIPLPKMSGVLGDKDAGTMSFYYDSKSPDAKIVTAVYSYYDQNGVLQNAVFKQNEINNAYELGTTLFNAQQINDEKGKQLIKEINTIVITTVAFEIGGPLVQKLIARLESGLVETANMETQIVSGASRAEYQGAEFIDDGARMVEQPFAETSAYANVSGPNSIKNIKTDVTKAEFGASLESAGYKKSMSRDGKATVYTKGDNRYSIRDNAGSYDGPTADFSKGEKTLTKIRLKKN